MDGLVLRGLNIPPDVQDADQLNIYAVQMRHPGIGVPVTDAENDDVIRIAETVLAWAEEIIP